MIYVLVVFITTLIICRWIFTKPRNLPPGPPCLPIVGSAPFVTSENFHLYLQKVKDKYGSVTSYKFGPTYVVAVTGAKEVKEVLSREDFMGRPNLPFVKPGIMFADGKEWSIQRKFTINHLKSFGFGKNSVENVILEEAEDFFQNVLKTQETVQVSGLFTVSVINVLWAMMGGKRYDHSDKSFKFLLDVLQRRFRSGNVTGGLSNSFPLIRKLFPKLKCFKDEIESEFYLDDFLQKSINEHKISNTEESRDFIDVYLKQLKNGDLHPSFSEERLKNICGELFSAGAESVGNSLGFCLLYLVLYPEWQDKLHEEIQSYTENDTRPFLQAKQSFPLVEAFLSEVTRCNTIASLTVPHRATRNTILSNYYIPKDTMLLISLWSVLQDKDHWKDPEVFRPERFLDENGSYKKDVEWTPAFGIGKRKCPGESLAKSIIFIFLIALIREFYFSIPKGDSKPSTLCLSGFTNAPRPFRINISKRK